MQNNDEAEKIAEAWLRSQKLNPQKNPDDPPDFLIEIAVEVTRLNVDEESVTKPLERVFEEVLEEMSEKYYRPDDSQGWRVGVGYDKGKGFPKKKRTREIILAAIEEVMGRDGSEYSKYLDKDSGIEISFIRKRSRPRFSFMGASPDEAEWVLPETVRRIRSRIKDKLERIQNRVNQHKVWWLLLVDLKNPVPNFGLSESEMVKLRAAIEIPHPLSRIVVLNPCGRVQVEWCRQLGKHLS